MTSNNPKMQRIKVEISNIESMIKAAWDIYQDPQTSFYPVIDSYQEIERIYKESFMNSNLWVYQYRDEFAYFPFIVDQDQQYVQANGGLACKRYFSEFSQWIEEDLQEKYKGYDFLVGYPSSNSEAMTYYQNHQSYNLQESLIRSEYVLGVCDYGSNIDGFGRLPSDKKTAFRSLHTKYNPDVYWDAAAILEHDDRWLVMSNLQDEIHSIIGAIIYNKEDLTYAEIYFIHSETKQEKILLESLLSNLHLLSVHSVLCLYEDNDPYIGEILAEKGFVIKGDYYSYTRVL